MWGPAYPDSGTAAPPVAGGSVPPCRILWKVDGIRPQRHLGRFSKLGDGTYSTMALTIRPSTTSRWTDCARRQAAQAYPEIVIAAGYTLRQMPSHIGAIVGTSVHAGGAQLQKAKRLSGTISPVQASTASEFAVHTFTEELDKAGVSWDDTTPNRNDAHKQIIRMTEVYREDVVSKVTPLEVEQRFEAMLPGGDVTISGQMDNIALFPQGPRDTKTGVRSAWNLPQYGCYSLLSRTHGFNVEQITEDFVQRVSPKRAQPRAVERVFDRLQCEQAAAAIVGLIQHQMNAFAETGSPWSFPANPNSMLCSDRFCPAFGTEWCSEWRAKEK